MNDSRFKLQFKGKYNKSSGLKSAMILGLSISILVTGWLMFGSTDSIKIEGNSVRQIGLITCSIIYVIRFMVTMFVFLKREMAWWEGIIGTVLFPFLIFCFLYVGGSQKLPINYVDIIGLTFYAIGSYLGTSSELSRHIWKLKSENKGHLYTMGLFKHSRHINYFGDVLLFSGFALITHDPKMLIIPMAMAMCFVLLWIPAHDRYLAKKYGIEFKNYANRTKKLIPLIY